LHQSKKGRKNKKKSKKALTKRDKVDILETRCAKQRVPNGKKKRK